MTISAPTPAEALAAPREFAIYSVSKDGKDGTVDASAFEKAVSHYGCKACGALPTSFAEFAAALKKPSSVESPSGEGDAVGLAAYERGAEVKPLRFSRRAVGPTDVRIEILYCGICHSDVHQIDNDWGQSSYPFVPGHEIVGVVTEVGSAVTKFAVGSRAAVGCMVSSCGECPACKRGEEQLCRKGPIWTYLSTDETGQVTQGGYSTQLVVREDFALRFPEAVPLDAGAPLLCAGITTYSPLVHFGLAGKRVGVLGLGGLGHIAVKLAKAMGCHVTVISTSPSKKKEAIEHLGADAFLISKDAEAMAGAAHSLDGILNLAPVALDLSLYLPLLDDDGYFIYLGIPSTTTTLVHGPLVAHRIRITGSPIGSIKQTQEMLDFCAEHGVACDVEVVKADYVNQAIERLKKNDVRYRFVIDIGASLIDESN